MIDKTRLTNGTLETVHTHNSGMVNIINIANLSDDRNNVLYD